MSSSWFDGIYWNDDDENKLLIEFEKMLEEQDNEYEELSKDRKITTTDPKNCRHVWIEVGRSPVLNDPWINCRKCNIKKEIYEKSLKSN